MTNRVQHMIAEWNAARAGLPRPELADNPNYAKLCDICRSQWPDC